MDILEFRSINARDSLLGHVTPRHRPTQLFQFPSPQVLRVAAKSLGRDEEAHYQSHQTINHESRLAINQTLNESTGIGFQSIQIKQSF